MCKQLYSFLVQVEGGQKYNILHYPLFYGPFRGLFESMDAKIQLIAEDISKVPLVWVFLPHDMDYVENEIKIA